MLRHKIRNMNPFRLLYSHPWPASSAIAPVLDKDRPTEEERGPYYNPRRLYPAKLGEILAGRYQIATKLGFGSSSTVWLGRDLFQYGLTPSPTRLVMIDSNLDGDGRRSVTLPSRSMQPVPEMMGRRRKSCASPSSCPLPIDNIKAGPSFGHSPTPSRSKDPTANISASSSNRYASHSGCCSVDAEGG